MISIENYKSITDKIEFELADYTVFAGKNNAGKSNILCHIHENYKKEVDPECEVIYIRSDQIDPRTECSTSQKGSEFSKTVVPILNEIVDETILSDLISKFDKSGEKKKAEDEINKILSDSGVEDKKVIISMGSDFGPDDVRKLIGVKALDQYREKDNEIDLDSIGQGSQRLMSIAFILYYKKIYASGGNKKILLLIEEPEAYLHPEWKKSLNTMIKKLLKKEDGSGVDVKVAITTHDPDFVRLNRDDKIYEVSRDQNTKSTTLKHMDNSWSVLGYRSHSEINYFVFNQLSESYFLELYEHFKIKSGINSYDKFDSERLAGKNNTEGKPLLADEKDASGNDITYVTKLRHEFAHPEEEKSVDEGLIAKGIKDLLRIFNDQAIES